MAHVDFILLFRTASQDLSPAAVSTQARGYQGSPVREEDVSHKPPLFFVDSPYSCGRLASTVVAGKKRDMYLYKERDVEWKAWERYGGPDGFEA